MKLVDRLNYEGLGLKQGYITLVVYRRRTNKKNILGAAWFDSTILGMFSSDDAAKRYIKYRGQLPSPWEKFNQEKEVEGYELEHSLLDYASGSDVCWARRDL
jgi:hypothetical protein